MSRAPSVARHEWAWALAFALIVMAATSLPYLLAARAQDDHWRFSGFLFAVEDGHSYIAKMAHGARGAWLFNLLYTSEPHTPALMFGFHFLLGKLAGPDHAALIFAYHAARFGLGLGLLLVSYRFLAEFLPRVGQRRLALALAALGGGLGWLLTLVGLGGLFGTLPIDFYSPEAYTFLILYSLPHLALARLGLLLGLLAYLRGRAVWAGAALFGVSLVQPLYLLAAWAVMGADTLADLWASRARLRHAPFHALWTAARPAMIAGLMSAPIVVYTIWIFNVDPILRQWNAQNRLPSPNPVHYLLGYGALIVPAITGAAVLWRRRPRLARFALGWALVVPVLIYLPIPTQRRLIEGFQLPLVALAVTGLTVGLRRWRRILLPVMLSLALPTSALLLWGGGLTAQQPRAPVFVAADQVRVFDWLSANAQPGQVALAAFSTGNALPAFAPLIAYIGHGPETAFLADKQPRAEAFYQSATPEAERRRLLADGRIAFVLAGPAERELGDFDLDQARYLRRRFAAGSYAVYEVQP